MIGEDQNEEALEARVMADTETVQEVKKGKKDEIDGEQIDSDEGEGEPDSKKAGESAKMAEEDSPPVAESVADAERVQDVKKDEKEEIDGKQIDSDMGGGEPNADCTYWASVGECQKNPDFMLSKCAKSCDEEEEGDDD